jgi:hypothetical protein
MIPVRGTILLLVLLARSPGPVIAQDHGVRHGFWAGLDLGYGSLRRSSDQEPARRDDTFAFALKLGTTLTPSFRPALEFNGWLLEAFNLNDPTKGESLSQDLLILQVYPWPATGFFIKGGVGRTEYTVNRPSQYGSSGWGNTLGAGNDLRVAKDVSLSVVLTYSWGSAGDVRNQLVTIANRQYRAFDVLVGITYH